MAEAITYDCPNCLEHYVLWDGVKPMSIQKQNDLSEMVRKQYDEQGTCKLCTRKDPNIPTVLEMDGLLTQEDIRNRNNVYMKCGAEDAWKIIDIRDPERVCPDCGGKLDGGSIISVRTFNPAWEKKFKKKKR